MTTTEQTPNIKELIRTNFIKNKAAAQAKADTFSNKQKFMESEWLRYYQDICKHSPNFQLVGKPMSESFRVFVQTYNPDGSFNRNEGMTVVDNIVVNYKSYEIVYTGKLPEGMTTPKVIVDEHITYRRSGWGSTNQGFKMKTRIQHEDSKFFKSGKKIVDIIESWVEDKWRVIILQKEKEDLKKRVIDIMSQKYPTSKVFFNKSNEVVVTNPNGTSVIMGYNVNEKNEVNYVVRRAEFTNINCDFLIEKLGSF